MTFVRKSPFSFETAKAYSSELSARSITLTLLDLLAEQPAKQATARTSAITSDVIFAIVFIVDTLSLFFDSTIIIMYIIHIVNIFFE